MSEPDPLRRNLPVIGSAVHVIVISVAVLSVPLAAAETLGLSEEQTSSWILAIYGLPGLLSLVLSLYYQQPLRLTGNIFVIISITQLGTQLGYPEIIGASILAGVVVLLIGVLGLTERFARWIPMPVVFGLLAGAVLPLVVGVFDQVGDAPILVSGTVLAYLASRGLLGRRVPAILPALVVGFAIAAVAGQYGEMPALISLKWPAVTLPAFSLPAILAAAPIFIVLITLQANVPSTRYLQSQDYCPASLMIDVVSGISTALGSLLGPVGVSLSLPVTALIAGPEAGDHAVRHRAVYLIAGVSLVIGLLAGIATAIAAAIPEPLLRTLAGLAAVNVLVGALDQMSRGPLLLGPALAFAVSLSEISILGLGPFFWALAIGTGVSLLLERDELRQVRAQMDEMANACRLGE